MHALKEATSATVAVCSWSLRARSAAELVQSVRACGLDAVQIALDHLRPGEAGAATLPEIETAARLRGAGIRIVSGMMMTRGEDYSTLESIARTGGLRPDDTWPANLASARDHARRAARLRLPLVTFHAGFIPHERENPERPKLLARLREVVDVFADAGVRIAFETGQESAQTLAEALDELDRPHAGVNFDPANMILYGMGDPLAALRLLGPRVAQVHIKDALPTRTPGTWGQEVRAGAGAVNWPAFFDALRELGGGRDLVIEREAGDDRLGDVTAARLLVEALA